MLLTYNSEAISAHTEVSDKFLLAFKEEVQKHYAFRHVSRTIEFPCDLIGSSQCLGVEIREQTNSPYKGVEHFTSRAEVFSVL